METYVVLHIHRSALRWKHLPFKYIWSALECTVFGYVFRNLVLLYLLRRRLCSHCCDSHLCVYVYMYVCYLHDICLERLHDECQRYPAHRTRLDTT